MNELDAKAVLAVHEARAVKLRARALRWQQQQRAQRDAARATLGLPPVRRGAPHVVFAVKSHAGEEVVTREELTKRIGAAAAMAVSRASKTGPVKWAGLTITRGAT